MPRWNGLFTRRSRDKPQGGASVYDKLRGVSLLPLRTRSQEGSLGTDVIYAAVTRIAGALASMPISLYRGGEEMRGEPLHQLLHVRPNRRMSAASFKRAVMGWVLTEGRGYAVMRMDAQGAVRELEVIDPRCVQPLIEQESGELWYAVTREDGVLEYLHSGYVLAFHHMTLDGLTSLRPIDVLKDALQYAQDIRTFSLESVKSGVNRAIVLAFPTEMDDGRRLRAVENFMTVYRKSGGQLLALDAGVTATRMDASPIDTGLEGVEKLTRSRVATVYNLPPHLLGDYSDATAASIEQQTVEFLTLTMQPIVTQWEEELDFKLLTPAQRAEGWHFRVDVDSYLRGDTQAMAARDQAAIRTGKRTVNELRARDYLPAVEGGDVALVSKDLAPVGMVAKGATSDADALRGEHNS